MNVQQQKIEDIEEIVQMLNNASLLVGDIEDSSMLRRRLPVAHLIYGQASTINCANYVMFIGLEKKQALGHPEQSTSEEHRMMVQQTVRTKEREEINRNVGDESPGDLLHTHASDETSPVSGEARPGTN